MENIIEEKEVQTIVNNITNVIAEVEKDVKDIVFKGFQIHGDKEQTTAMMSSFAKYFSEIQNPANSKINPFLKNSYAPMSEVLNTIRPVMSKYGLSFMQVPTMTDTQEVKIDTLIMHESGAYISIEGMSLKPAKLTAQDIGGIMTYLRRYIISTLAGISSEDDDDGNGASDKKASKKAKEPEEVEKMTFVTLKARVTTLAKDKISETSKDVVTSKIEEVLGKGVTISKTTEEDKEKVVELYTELQKL